MDTFRCELCRGPCMCRRGARSMSSTRSTVMDGTSVACSSSTAAWNPRPSRHCRHLDLDLDLRGLLLQKDGATRSRAKREGSSDWRSRESGSRDRRSTRGRSDSRDRRSSGKGRDGWDDFKRSRCEGSPESHRSGRHGPASAASAARRYFDRERSRSSACSNSSRSSWPGRFSRYDKEAPAASRGPRSAPRVVLLPGQARQGRQGGLGDQLQRRVALLREQRIRRRAMLASMELRAAQAAQAGEAPRSDQDADEGHDESRDEGHGFDDDDERAAGVASIRCLIPGMVPARFVTAVTREEADKDLVEDEDSARESSVEFHVTLNGSHGGPRRWLTKPKWVADRREPKRPWGLGRGQGRGRPKASVQGQWRNPRGPRGRPKAGVQEGQRLAAAPDPVVSRAVADAHSEMNAGAAAMKEQLRKRFEATALALGIKTSRGGSGAQ